MKRIILVCSVALLLVLFCLTALADEKKPDGAVPMPNAEELATRWAALSDEQRTAIYDAKEALIGAETALLEQYAASGILPEAFAKALINAEQENFRQNREAGALPDFCRPPKGCH